jgi:hypothetical protein
MEKRENGESSAVYTRKKKKGEFKKRKLSSN